MSLDPIDNRRGSNIRSQPQVKVRVGDSEFNAIARMVHNDLEPQIVATAKALFDASTAGATAS